MLAIDFQYASKEYRHRTGLEEARFSVEAGSFFGILGPSQSGKSTIVRLLFDYIHPTGGDVLVFEWNSVRDSVRIRQAAGYVPARVTGHSRMTVHDLLVFLCSSAGRVDEARLRELCMKFHLEPRARFDALEDGERKKLVFVSVLLRDPPLLVLDEPSLGLAPFEREAVFAATAPTPRSCRTAPCCARARCGRWISCAPAASPLPPTAPRKPPTRWASSISRATTVP